jgi:hypothetical protein
MRKTVSIRFVYRLEIKEPALRYAAKSLQQLVLLVESALLFRDQLFLRCTLTAQLLHELLHGLKLFTNMAISTSRFTCRARVSLTSWLRAIV